MSRRALPLLFVNLGGEMMYILDQRLAAQNIPADKSQKVLNDIISCMLNTKFIEELFTPQELYSKMALKLAFEKLAHASIMRLNTSSMDKLYDLITMAVKYQVFSCPRPSDLLLITLNHVDALRNMANLDNVSQQVDFLYQKIMKAYCSLSQMQFQLIKYTMLSFFQDVHIRVSMFLKDQTQNPNGRFVVPILGPVPFGTEVPGVIRYYNSNDDMSRIKHFQNGGKYQIATRPGSTDLKAADRGIKLGTNMYSLPKEGAKKGLGNLESPSLTSQTTAEDEPQNTTLAKEELNFLAKLLGGTKISTQKAEFRLHLFDLNTTEEDDDVTNEESKKGKLLDMTPTQDNEELSKIMGEMSKYSQLEAANDNEASDLLDLMDKACI